MKPQQTETAAASNGSRLPNINYQVQDTPLAFRRATKQDAKLRFAIAGPSGSGKTYTLLKLATELGGPIAVVDTEQGSAEKYADLFEFDTLPLRSFSPDLVPQLINAAAEQGYKVLIIDSLSHFWTGTDGELDQVERVKMRMRDNGWAAWREITPKHNRLIDAMVAAPLHVLVAMRVKTEWVVEKGDDGKTKPRKIGMQPVMRDGIEYEFDVCGDMDQEHNLIISKSRCPALADQVYNKPGLAVAAILRNWLRAPKTTPQQKELVRARLEELAAPAPQAPAVAPAKPPASATTAAPEPPPQAPERPWKKKEERNAAFAEVREKVGEVRYLGELDLAGGENLFRSWNASIAFYRLLCAIARKEVA